MIERLEGEGGYNEDFLNEFRTFRGELRDFFNASSFTDMLAAVRPSFDEADAQVGTRVDSVRPPAQTSQAACGAASCSHS